MCQVAVPSAPVSDRPVLEQLVELGRGMNHNQYQTVHLAARYEKSMEWLYDGLSSAALGIARQLDIHTTADQLTNAIARLLDENDPDDDAKDQRHHDYRSFTTYTNDDGMTVLRAVLPPGLAKPIIAAIDELVRHIANTPEGDEVTEPACEPSTTTSDPDAPAGAPQQPTVTNTEEPTTHSGQHTPAGASLPLTLQEPRHTVTSELEPRCAPCHRARHRHDRHRHEGRSQHGDDQAA